MPYGGLTSEKYLTRANLCKARTVEKELRRVRGRRANDIVKEEDSNASSYP